MSDDQDIDREVGPVDLSDPLDKLGIWVMSSLLGSETIEQILDSAVRHLSWPEREDVSARLKAAAESDMTDAELCVFWGDTGASIAPYPSSARGFIAMMAERLLDPALVSRIEPDGSIPAHLRVDWKPPG